MCLYWNSYPGLLRVIGYYEFVLNVKISGMDIFFNAVFLFEVFKKYWSSLLQQECVLSLLEILWSQFSFQKNPSVLKGCLLASCSGHVFYSFSLLFPLFLVEKLCSSNSLGGQLPCFQIWEVSWKHPSFVWFCFCWYSRLIQCLGQWLLPGFG